MDAQTEYDESTSAMRGILYGLLFSLIVLGIAFGVGYVLTAELLR